MSLISLWIFKPGVKMDISSLTNQATYVLYQNCRTTSMILKTSSDSHIDHLKFVSCNNKKYTDASSAIVFWLLWLSPCVLVMFARMLGTVVKTPCRWVM